MTTQSPAHAAFAATSTAISDSGLRLRRASEKEKAA
jgi:hypothetical protein